MNEIQITDVRIVPGDSGFLLDDRQTAILYDSGFAFTGDALAQKLRSILGERPLNYVFLTHSHYDHALGAAYVRKYWPGARIVAGEYAANIFARPSAKGLMRELDRKFANECGVGAYEDRIDELTVDIAVRDGDRIQAGDMEFTAVALPGHTKCSVGYYCAALRLLLGCETLGVFNGKDEVVPACLVGYQMTLDSIDRAAQLAIDRMLVPHFGAIDGETAAFYLKRAKESAAEAAGQILAIRRGGGSREEAVAWFRHRFYHGYVREIYPQNAMELNTGITVDLLEKELGGKE